MTDQTTLDRMISDADLESRVADMMLGAWRPRDGVVEFERRQARAVHADAELDALRQLVAE